MMQSPGQILSILDSCCDNFTFPMLDNGYVYPAATRLSLFHSSNDWAMVIEVFGYSPREGLPSTHISTFGSTLHNRKRPDDFVTPSAYQTWQANNPNNDMAFVYPIEDGPWMDEDNPELVSQQAQDLVLRGRRVEVPDAEACRRAGVAIAEPPRVQVFELCRAIAYSAREDVLATPAERRTNVPPELSLLLTLDEWAHPDVVRPSARPGRSSTFQQLAQVLAAGDISRYRPEEEPNTHWRNWPEGGTL